MIAQVSTPYRRRQFCAACRGKPFFGAALPVQLRLFGAAMPGRFYAGPGLAIDLAGPEAVVCGHAHPEELAAFLAFAGVQRILADGPAPAGWRQAGQRYLFMLLPGAQLPLPPVDQALWQSLALHTAPPAMPVAQLLWPAHPARRDELYAEICAKRLHGCAEVWALAPPSAPAAPVATVGVYALTAAEAYMACGIAAPAVRGQGLGGRLIVQMANAFAARGRTVTLLCPAQRVAFYTRLGFAPAGAVPVYAAPGMAGS